MSRSIPNTPANVLTPNFTTVSSPGGFSSGDLVYFRDSSFGTIPNNAVANAPFPIDATLPIGGPFGANAFIGTFNENLNKAVFGRQRFAAALSNGNIVVVYAGGDFQSTSQGRPLFRIVTDNFANVVAETQISTTDTVRISAIGVAALTGGGFAVAYIDATSNARIAVFSNTGAVVTAPFTPAGWATGWTIDIEPLPSGGFVVAMNNASSGNQYRVATFTATGTQVNTNSPVISNFSSNDTPQLAVLSDGRFVVLTRSAASTAILQGFNANCTTVGAAQTFSIGDVGSGGGYSICTLTNNDVVMGMVDGGIGYVRNYFIDTNSFGSWTQLNGGATAYAPTIFPMPGGNVGALMLLNSPSGGVAFQVLSNTFVSQSLTAYRGISLDNANANASAVSAVLTTGKLTVFMSSLNSTNPSSPATPIQYFQFGSATPFSPIYRRTQSIRLGSVNSPVSGYARSNSTPNAASFLSSTTTTLSTSFTTMTGSGYIRSPYAAKAGVTYLDSCVLSDGRMVVAYSTGTSVAGFVTIDQAGSVTSDTTFSLSGAAVNSIKCAALNNGKLVLAMGPSSNTDIFIRVYSANLVLESSSSLLAASGITPRDVSAVSNGGFGISSVGSNRFVLGFCNNANNLGTAAIFTDAIGVVTTITGSGSTTQQGISVSGNIDGSFTMVAYQNSPGQGRYGRYIQTGDTSWSLSIGNNFSWSSANAMSITAKTHPSGVAYHVLNPTGSGASAQLCIIGNGSSRISFTIGSGQYNMGCAVAIGATGEVVAISTDTSGVNPDQLSVFAPSTYIISGSNSVFTNTITVPNKQGTTSQQGPSVCLECLYGQTYALAYRSSANEMLIGTFSTQNITYSTNITAGVTPSGTGLVPSPANGYYLAGVSASDCAAGGTGVLQINGTATLNSQYPAGTTSQAFDFNTPALDVGVRGTIAGRNVILSGGK